jgi:hypothetical protein
MTSVGYPSLDTIGRKMMFGARSLTVDVTTTMSILETLLDLLLHPSLIDATGLCVEPFI